MDLLPSRLFGLSFTTPFTNKVLPFSTMVNPHLSVFLLRHYDGSSLNLVVSVDL